MSIFYVSYLSINSLISLHGYLQNPMDVIMIKVSIIFSLYIYKMPLGTAMVRDTIISSLDSLKILWSLQWSEPYHLLPEYLSKSMAIQSLEQTFKALPALASAFLNSLNPYWPLSTFIM